MTSGRRIYWLLQFWRPVRALLIIAGILTVCHAAFKLSAPYLLKLVVDGIQAGVPATVHTMYIGLLVLVGLGAAGSYAWLQSTRMRVNTTLDRDIRNRLFDHLTLVGHRFFARFNRGDVVTRLTNDLTDKIAWFGCSGLFRLAEAAVLFITSVVLMINISVSLTLLSLIPLPALAFTFHLMSGKLRGRHEHIQRVSSAINERIAACFSGIHTVKAYGREDAETARFSHLVDEKKDAQISLVKLRSLLHMGTTLLGEVGVALVIGVGGFMVMNGALTLGGLVAFKAYLLMLIGPLSSFGSFLAMLNQADVSIGRLMELEAWPAEMAERPGATPLPPVIGAIEFQNLSFAFEGGRDVLNGVSFKVARGSRVGIAGPVGSGKTTLLRLAVGELTPINGRILVNQTELTADNRHSWQRRVGYVPQESIILSRSLAENVRFERDDIGQDAVLRALAVAQLEEDILELPGGVDEIVGPRGVTLSGGQRQRICIARALAHKPDVLVFDDFTSQIDSRTEANLWEALEREFPDATYLVASHRPATLARMDEVVVLDGGRIVERGSHGELLKRDGTYASLMRRETIRQDLEQER